MLCRSCKREIPDNSIYCNWCGEKQLRERKKKDVIKVPTPKQLPSGNWNIVLRAEGQSVTEPTKELCITRARAIRAGFLEQQKENAARGQTLREAIDAYIEKYGAVLSPSTVRGYDQIKKHRFPGKIDRPLRNTTGWQAEIDAAKAMYAPKTIKNSWGLVATVMRENNVAVPSIKLPQKKGKKNAPLPWLTHSQVLVFVEAIRGTKIETAALFALHSLRQSEIFALTWDNIDLENRRITVAGARVKNKDNKWELKAENKTTESARTIRIMIPNLYEKLIELKKNGCAPVQCTQGSLTESINLVCRKNGLPKCGTHGLRRSFASLAYHLGISERETMEIGGWSDPKVMHSIYIQIEKEDRLKAENKMGEFYRTNGKTTRDLQTDLQTSKKDA